MEKKDSPFAAAVKRTALITCVATAVLVWLHHVHPTGFLLSAAITAGTTFYHFAMRLLVGTVVPRCMKNPMARRWFAEKPFEPRLYAFLRVKQWKDRMPTYDPASFSLRTNSLEQIICNSCVSEAVHEVIILFSFIPLLFTIFWGALPVFAVTSILAALFDSCFVVMQRYNRPRLLRILSKKEAQGQ